VPYRLVHATVDVRLTARAVELLHNGVRVAAYARSYERVKATTDPAQFPMTPTRKIKGNLEFHQLNWYEIKKQRRYLSEYRSL